VESGARKACQRPRFFICGNGVGARMVGEAILHVLEELPLFNLDMSTLLTDTTARYGAAVCTRTHTSLQPCLFVTEVVFSPPPPCLRTPAEALAHRITEARKSAPCVLYLPRADVWWDSADASVRSCLVDCLDALPPSLPVLLLSVSEAAFAEQDQELLRVVCSEAFSRDAFLDAWLQGSGMTPPNRRFEVPAPDDRAREAFFSEMLNCAAMQALRSPRTVPASAAPAAPFSHTLAVKKRHATRTCVVWRCDVPPLCPRSSLLRACDACTVRRCCHSRRLERRRSPAPRSWR
jgi:hypothetical protein